MSRAAAEKRREEYRRVWRVLDDLGGPAKVATIAGGLNRRSVGSTARTLRRMVAEGYVWCFDDHARSPSSTPPKPAVAPRLYMARVRP